MELILFLAGLVLYLVTRFVGVEEFPIYFFSDEAAQTVLAADLVQDQFRHQDVLLPTYFFNVHKYNLGVSVYIQLVPYLLFGKSILVTRGTAAIMTLVAALTIGLILKLIWQLPYWWCGVLLLSLSPAWFLHSRTAFETSLAVSFYALFLLGYSCYLHFSPKYLKLTLIAGAFTFYTYDPARIVILVTGLLLLIVDFRFHWRHRWVIRRNWWLIVLLILPYLRFQASHLFAEQEQLYLLDSYWIQNIPLSEKLIHYGSRYIYALSPRYWFFPNQHDLIRHVMKGYGHLLWITLPFGLVGLGLALKNWRVPAYRTLLVALIAAPAGSAISEILITRVLTFIIPATLLSTIGLAKVLNLIESRLVPKKTLALSLFITLSVGNLYMLQDALRNGPTWFTDYGLYGMQYGSPQLFEAVEDYLYREPERQIIISPRWTNGPQMVMDFFLENQESVRWGAIDDDLEFGDPINASALYVMTPNEFQLATSSDRITAIQIEQIVAYPDGRPGFYFGSFLAEPP